MRPFAHSSRFIRRTVAGVVALLLGASLGISGGALAASGEDLGTISGTVTGSGVPIDGVAITIHGDAGDVNATTVDGLYTVEGLADGTYSIDAVPTGLDFSATTLHDVIVVSGTTTTADITLPVRDNFVIKGTVTFLGAPIAGVNVVVTDPYNSGGPWSAITGADGTYLIDHLTFADATVSIDGTGTDYFNYLRWSLPLGPTPLIHNITLTPLPIHDGTISGVVTDRETGLPIENAPVVLRAVENTWNRTVYTSSTGEYFVDDVIYGTITVEVEDFKVPGYFGTTTNVIVSAANPDRLRNLGLRMLPHGTAVVGGTVTLDGVPVEGARVFVVYKPTNRVDAQTTTDVDGIYTIPNLPAGSYYVSSMLPSSITQPVRALTIAQSSVTVPTSSSVVTHDLALTSYATGNAYFNGRLLDSLTNLAIAGASIYLTPTAVDGQGAVTTTDSTGAWDAGPLPAGEYKLEIYPQQSNDFVLEEPSFVTLFDGVTSRHVIYRESLAPGAGSVQGKVTDTATHLPIAAVDLLFERRGGGFSAGPITTDNSGRYSVAGLPDGSYDVTITGPLAYGGEYANVDIFGGSAETLNLGLTGVPALSPAGNGVITGHVLDASSNPIADASLWIYPASEGRNAGIATYADEAGAFELGDLKLTDLVIEVSGPEHAAESYAKATVQVTLSATQSNADVTVHLDRASQISGTVSNPSSSKSIVARAIDTVTGDVAGQGVVDPYTGDYLIDWLPGGSYIVQFIVNHDSGQYWYEPTTADSIAQAYWVDGTASGSADPADATPIVLLAGGLVDSIDMTMLRGGAISGDVAVTTATTPTPLTPGRLVQVTAYRHTADGWDALDLAIARVSQFSGSEFVISELAPGDYALEFVDLWSTNRAYVKTYNGGAKTLDTAPLIHVTAGHTSTSGTTLMSVAAPTTESDEVDLSTLTPEELAALEDGIGADDDQTAGETTDLDLGEEFAGEWVSVWANSTPTQVSTWVLVGADGTVTVTLPTNLVGDHKLVVVDADQSLLGWTGVSIAEPTVAPNGGGSSGPSGGPKTSVAAKPSTDVVVTELETGSPSESETDTPVKTDAEKPTTDVASPAATTDEGGFDPALLWLVIGLVLLVVVGGVATAFVIRRRA